MSALREIVLSMVVLSSLCLGQSKAVAQSSIVFPGAAQVATGYVHACSLMVDGNVRCWGYNRNGELGTGSLIDSAFPIAVTGLNGVVTDIATGDSHSCAVGSGKVMCWGYNAKGELGNNSSESSAIPVAVSNISAGATVVKAGGDHTCAIVGNGLQCWGANDEGQLGNNSTDESHVPVAVSGLTGVSAVAAGLNFTCALASGAVTCWGDGTYGQLGNGMLNSQSSVPVPVSGLGSGVTAIAAGGFTACALVGSSVRCWGDGVSGQLGDGSSGNGDFQPTPVLVSGLGAAASNISVGLSHACASTASLTQCWGDNTLGKLGNSGSANSSVPVPVNGLGAAASLATGGTFSCALAAGVIQCWGLDQYGQLGDISLEASTRPVAVSGLDGTTFAIATGDGHTCAAGNTGIFCWGYNFDGELAYDPNLLAYSSTPLGPVPSSTGASALGAGGDHSCMVVSGSVKCWGVGGDGQLGNGDTTDSWQPVAVFGLSSATATVSGGQQSCAIVVGGAQCWGYNGDGELGNSSTAQSSIPVQVSGLTNAVSVLASGQYHSCAIVGVGAQCWGDNVNGALGDASFTAGFSDSPRQVTGLTAGVTGIAAGIYHSCAIVNGGAQCWGVNTVGELGDGTTLTSISAVPVFGLGSGVSALAAGDDHSCAIVQGGTVFCWGYNGAGQLGDGTFVSRNKPVLVTGLGGAAIAIAAGGNHSCALLANDTVRCWGDNFYGELGSYRQIYALTPVHVQVPDDIFLDGLGD